MHLTQCDIKKADRIWRLNLINSITGIKPANLIGSISSAGVPNLAIFSSVVHLGSDPALLGFVTRPSDQVRRDTYENIISTKKYTINSIHIKFARHAHYTSAKFQEGISEFEVCNLKEEYISGFKAPFVKQSAIKIGLTLKDIIPIKANKTKLIVGQIDQLILPDRSIDKSGSVKLQNLDVAGISGLNHYYTNDIVASFPYARENEVPNLPTVK